MKMSKLRRFVNRLLRRKCFYYGECGDNTNCKGYEDNCGGYSTVEDDSL